jgi:replicative DNA helicase
LNIAENVAVNEGLPVLVFSMEMGASQLALRMVGSLGRIDQSGCAPGASRTTTGGGCPKRWTSSRTPRIFIDETPALNAAELRASARRRRAQCGGTLGLIVIDYLQLMSGVWQRREPRHRIGEISRGLKALAKELQCPVIALSQLNRSVETRNDKRPMMSDLRESGAIEQDADVIMFIYRDDYYNKESKEPGRGRDRHRQAAQRPRGHGQADLPEAVDQVRQPRARQLRIERLLNCPLALRQMLYIFTACIDRRKPDRRLPCRPPAQEP